MNLFQLILKQMRQRALSTWLTLLSVMLGVALAVAVMVVSREGDKLFGQSDFGYDVIIGAKGSKLGLVLNCVYQLGQSPGNIPYAAYDELPERFGASVQWAVPIAVGDQYKDHRIVATTPAMFGLDDAGRPLDPAIVFQYRKGRSYALAEGSVFHPRKFEAIIGSEVAARGVLKIGSTFHPEHGLGAVDELSRDEHEEQWQVVGVLARTGTASDKVIFTPLASFYAIPAHEQGLEAQAQLETQRSAATSPDAEHGDHAEHEPAYVLAEDGTIELRLPPEKWKLSAIFVRTRGSAVGTMNMLWTFNNLPGAMAVSPAREMKEFFETFLQGGSMVMVMVALLVSIVAAVSILVSIYNSVSARMREISILRALGATRVRILVLICLEAGLVGLAGGILGLLAGHLLAAAGSLMMQRFVGESIDWVAIGPAEGLYLGVVVLIAFLAGLVPALKAYRSPVATNLVSA
jgi:putative ABC transport system permease protein